MSVRELLRAYREGRAEAGQALWRRYEPWLRVLARVQVESRFRAKFDPSDIVQQTMMEAVRAFPGFRGQSEGEFGAWLRRILSHALAHEVRRYAGTAKRDMGREVSLEEDLSRTSERLVEVLAASGSSPSQQVVRREQAARLAEVLERLPADYREVILLRHVEGLPHEEVARRMGRRSGAVRMLWVRALARLQEEMGKGTGGGARDGLAGGVGGG